MTLKGTDTLIIQKLPKKHLEIHFFAFPSGVPLNEVAKDTGHEAIFPAP